MTGEAHNGGAPGGAGFDPKLVDPAAVDPVLLAAQRQRARRGAVLLGFVALLTYVGFILATSLRH